MTHTVPQARTALLSALDAASAASSAGDRKTMWTNLEDAHILSQPDAVAHVRVHIRMLAEGWRERDWLEVRGQVLRSLVAAPGSWTGRYPRGNTGRARVPATQPMPVRPDLEQLLTP